MLREDNPGLAGIGSRRVKRGGAFWHICVSRATSGYHGGQKTREKDAEDPSARFGLCITLYTSKRPRNLAYVVIHIKTHQGVIITVCNHNKGQIARPFAERRWYAPPKSGHCVMTRNQHHECQKSAPHPRARVRVNPPTTPSVVRLIIVS